MPRHSIPRVWPISLVVVAWLMASPAASAQPGADRAMDLYRRQLRERKTKRWEMIARISAIADPPPAPRVVQGGIMVRGAIRIAGEAFLVKDTLVLEQEERPPADPGDDDEPGRTAPVGKASLVVAEENFDRWLFEGLDTEDLRRGRLDQILARTVDQASEVNRLTPAQADKLRLAGRGDIKRFFDAVEERRRDFDEARRELKAGINSLQGLSPLIADFRDGPFGAASIYHKTLTKILNERDVLRRPR